MEMIVTECAINVAMGYLIPVKNAMTAIPATPMHVPTHVWTLYVEIRTYDQDKKNATTAVR